MTAPLAWLLDTNVVSEMMRPPPEPRVAAFLDSVAGEGLGLSTLTIYEANRDLMRARLAEWPSPQHPGRAVPRSA